MFQNFLSARKNIKEYDRLSSDFKEIVFYSESKTYWDYFVNIINELNNSHKKRITFLTSDYNDFAFNYSNKNLKVLYIGDGILRTIFLRRIDAKVIVMTMPDLDSFHIKRSINKVKYIYLFHSLVSTHMVYRKGAFDSYDEIFCSGPHHKRELRVIENHYNLKRKKISKVGYPRLDSQLSYVQNCQIKKNVFPTVIIAPSWGDNGLLEKYSVELLTTLANYEYDVIIRPHPQTLRIHKDIFQSLNQFCIENERFSIDLDISSYESFNKSDIMISDWSGAALEFSLAFYKPVIFIDVDKKINNIDYASYEIEPLEIFIRDKIGKILKKDNIFNINIFIEDLLAFNKKDFKVLIDSIRREVVYNEGKSHIIAAKRLVSILSEI